MTDHELDARFEEAAKLLTSAAWEREPLFTLAHTVAEAQQRKDQEAAALALRTLRDHIRQRAAEIRASLDQLLEDVPCTIHARILYMELLTDKPCLPGSNVDNERRAQGLVHSVQQHLFHPWEDERRNYDERLKIEGIAAAQAYEKNVQAWNRWRQDAAGRDLRVEALRIFQQLQESGERWMKRPKSGSTFADHFSTEQWAKVERAMQATGIRPIAIKGKKNLVAAVHAGFVHYKIRIPATGQWLEILRNTYPSVDWSDKCKPEERPSFRTKSYQHAYLATLDRLQ